MGRNQLIHLKARFWGASQQHVASHRRNIFQLLSAILIMGLAAAACTFTPTVTGQPSAPAPASPIASTATDTPVPSETPVAATATDTSTSTPATPTANPTSALAAACGDAPAMLSPDGQWVFCDAKVSKGILFQSAPFVVGANGKRWNIDYKTIDKSTRDNGQFEFNNQVIYWTPDERSVYVMPWAPDASVGRVFPGGFDVWKLDLSSGATQSLLFTNTQMGYTDNTYSLAISPDGSRLAYVFQWGTPLMLGILNLGTGKKTEVKIADTNLSTPTLGSAGELVWSQDGQKLAYKLIILKGTNSCAYDYSIELMTFPGMSTRTILPPTHLGYCKRADLEYTVRQVDARGILLELQGNPWRYDLTTNKLEQLATPTATP